MYSMRVRILDTLGWILLFFSKGFLLNWTNSNIEIIVTMAFFTAPICLFGYYKWLEPVPPVNDGHVIMTGLRPNIKITLPLAVIISACLQAVVIIYLLGGEFIMNWLLSISDNIMELISYSTAVLGIISLIITSVETYVQTNKSGIPFKMGYARIYDFFDTFIEMFLIFGVGAILPFLSIIFYATFLYETESAIIVVISTIVMCVVCWTCVFIGIFSSKGIRLRVSLNIYNIPKLKLFFGIPITVVAGAFVYFGYDLHKGMQVIEGTEYKLNGFFAGIVACYFIIILAIIYIEFMRRIFGSEDEVVLTTIEEKLYWVAMRYNSEKWIMIPCEIGLVQRPLIIAMFRIDRFIAVQKTIEFEKGNFIVRDLEGLTMQKKHFVLLKGKRYEHFRKTVHR